MSFASLDRTRFIELGDGTRRGAMASAYGSWWADASVLAGIGNRILKFEGWLPANLLRKAWPTQYRGAAALCEDWNDLREMFKLEIPSGQELIGLTGLTAPQPQNSG